MITALKSPRRALLSVSDKQGLIPFAQLLQAQGWEILSTGGTAKYLRDAGINLREVAEITGFPEILEGRVKTLHPHIHGALLAKRDDSSHQAQLQEFGIGLIDLLVVNLYPFVETIAKTNVSLDEAIENIDVGGPAMIRAAAKNHAHVLVLVDPHDYPIVMKSIDQGNLPDINGRRAFAQKAFAHTSSYDHAVQAYLQKTLMPSNHVSALPASLSTTWVEIQAMRYGENAHQNAALYAPLGQPPQGLVGAKVLQGKAMSYNNFSDTDAALRCVMEFSSPACVIVKHANPCGVALGETILLAYQRAFSCDPTSAFGGIIAFNRDVDAQVASAIGEQFAEVVVGPNFTDEALLIFSKKTNLRLIQMSFDQRPITLEMRTILGGLLVQTPDNKIVDEMSVVSRAQPTSKDWEDLRFAFTVAKHVKSNAIVFTRDGQTLGIGAGQMSRVDSTRIAAWKAQDRGFNVQGAVAASDAFFPFRDGLDALAKAGARAVIQPGGSMRDEEVIQAANEHGLIMVTTGIRHFRH